MKIKKDSNKKLIILIIVLILMVSSVVAGAIVYNNQQTKDSAKEKQETKDNIDDNEKKSDSDDDKESSDSLTADGNSSITTDEKTPTRYEGGSVQNSDELTGTVGVATPVKDIMTVRVTIHQLVGDANGTCTLNLAGPDGQTYSEQAKMMDNPQTSTCYGWDIPVDKVGFTNGRWKITVFLNGGGKTGTITNEVDL